MVTRLVSCVEDGLGDYIITIEERKFFGFGKPITKRLVGSGTVYHYIPSGKRASSSTEYWLADVTFIHKYNKGK